MAFFALKISDPASLDLVNEIKAGSEEFFVNQLNQLETDLKVGNYVFIQLGGNIVAWDKGLIGLAKIIKEPHDKGYDTSNARNFRLGLKMVLVLKSVIKREEFKYYINAYDAGGIGPNTKGEQNQAIKALTDTQAYTIIRAMVDKQNDQEEKIRGLFSEDVCKKIFGEIPFLFEQNISYRVFLDSKKCTLKKYKEASLEERKNYFVAWGSEQKTSDDDDKTKTSKNYASSLKNDASKLSDLEIEEKNLFYYYSIAEFDGIVDAIKDCSNYYEVNIKGHYTFSSALNWYKLFLSSLVDEKDDTEKELTCLDIELLPRKRTTYPLNFILYGAPGTGKTYSTPEYAVAITKNIKIDELENHEMVLKEYKELVKKNQVVFTTFHQNYGYEEFIQGLRPDPKAETLKFKTIDGCFKKIADIALNNPEKDYVIIIDEINRANISKVFGELITLIEDDKRWGEKNEMCVTLQSGSIFTVPNNLYIVGTMNSADKSISLIDAALRRRFEFIEQRPNKELIDDKDLQTIFNRLNKHLADKLKSSDLLIGHSYFMNRNLDDLSELMNNKIIPLLYEYFYDQKDKVKNALEVALTDYESLVAIEDDVIGRLRVKMVEKE